MLSGETTTGRLESGTRHSFGPFEVLEAPRRLAGYDIFAARHRLGRLEPALARKPVQSFAELFRPVFASVMTKLMTKLRTRDLEARVSSSALNTPSYPS